MGFNARLAPYTIEKTIEVRGTSKGAAVSQHFPIHKFAFASQLVGAFANVRRIIVAGTGVDLGVVADTTTGVDEVSIWKHATADTTATYATALRAAARTGVQAAAALVWAIPVTSGVGGTSGAPSLYTLTNKSAARRKFVAGDVAYMHFGPYGATNLDRAHVVDIQMDFIIGHEAS